MVDDDPLVLTNLVAMLEDLGHKVVETASGPDAIAMLRREQLFQMVITDYAMPGMTGVELINEIMKEFPDLPVILATGYAELPRGLDSSWVTLAKPFLQYDLAKAVRSALEDPGTRRVGEFRAPGQLP